ncbi:MAG: DISARM system SNF2-like helicase DrmD [Bacteroidetes bacterium]|nr:DISARM system SNF2-like helicase DrmD [Bacteroidota bacterium]
MVLVRNRPAIVREIKKSQSAEGTITHSVQIEYIDGFTHPERDLVIWQREINTKVIKGITLPDISNLNSIDDPEYFYAFLNCYKWAINNSIKNFSSPADNDIQLISPWQSAIQIQDYQLFPLLQAVSMPRISLLLADDVGLGKTIEAGLILNELIARGRLRRILIICPAALQVQWRDEMSEKFYIDFQIINRETTYQLQKEFGVDSNPWSSYPYIITSLDYLRQRDVLQRFMASSELFVKENDAMLPWDMLIVDEAHNISSRFYGEDTERLRMIRQVIPLFENKLFLTATPHNGYTESFSGLLELLNPLVFEQKRVLEEKDHLFIEEYVIRRLKSYFSKDGLLERFTQRSIHRVDKDYKLLPFEKQLFEALKEYKAKAIKVAYADYGTNKIIIGFLLTLLTKRLLSSVYSFGVTWWNHFVGLKNEIAEDVDIAHLINRAQEDIVDDEEKDLREDEVSRQIGSWLARNADKLKPEINRINKLLTEIGWTQKIIDSKVEEANEFPNDSKWLSLEKWINEKLIEKKKFKQDERVIIFTEYKNTQNYLIAQFSKIEIKSPRMEILNGRSTQKERETVKEYFNDDDSPLKILLVTDVASEGINLQNNCRYVIHYEIPWNPMRLEQRNGRVDRFGQRRNVEAFHFVSDEEQDLKFLERVVNKVENIREDLGNVSELFDKSLEDYFLGDSALQKNAILSIDNISADVTDTNDLKNSSKGSEDEYKKAYQRFKATELNLGLTPQNLAQLLQIAFQLEGGKLAPHSNDIEVYQIEVIPTKWKKLIQSSLTIKTGRQTGALSKIVFDSSYFEKVENGRLVYLNKPDTRLIRLGHPLMKRAIGLIKKKLWSTEELIDGTGKLNRVTIQKTQLPSGIDIVLVSHILIEATNELHENIHNEVNSIPYVLSNSKINEVDNQLWQNIKSQPKNILTSKELNNWLPVIKNRWLELEDNFKTRIKELKLSFSSDFESSLKQGLESALKDNEKVYNDRLEELKKKKSSGYLDKLKKQLDVEKQKLEQQSLFEDVNKQKLNRIRELEINLEKHQTNKIQYLQQVLMSEKTKIINNILPKRFTINHFDVYPLGIEILINNKLLD